MHTDNLTFRKLRYILHCHQGHSLLTLPFRRFLVSAGGFYKISSKCPGSIPDWPLQRSAGSAANRAAPHRLSVTSKQTDNRPRHDVNQRLQGGPAGAAGLRRSGRHPAPAPRTGETGPEGEGSKYCFPLENCGKFLSFGYLRSVRNLWHVSGCGSLRNPQEAPRW
jgi:hypothetical protein